LCECIYCIRKIKIQKDSQKPSQPLKKISAM
jgi:hypothetical protein